MKGKYLMLIVLIPFSLLISACNGDRSIDPVDSADFEDYLNDEMDRQHVPAASVLLFRDRTVLYERYFGQADLENDVNLNANHIFLLASVSKTVTATALMQLFEAGEFELDDPINAHLPFAVENPNGGSAITFRHLLTHTSGILDAESLDDQYFYGTDSPVNLTDFMRDYLVASGPLYDERENFADFKAGDGYEYSNTGAALMAVLVEEISGLDFNSYCKQNIFQPLGMTRTFWKLSETDTTTIVRPYEFNRGDYQPLQHYTFTDYPNGGLRSNAMDLFQFCQAFANQGSFGGGQLLQPATVDEMLRLQISDLDETQGLSFYYLNVSEGLWGHEGAEMGVSTAIALNPDNRTGVIVLTNGDDADLTDIVVSAYRLAQKL
jgi:CubicO group peptidase (beta-lactamase class C family)